MTRDTHDSVEAFDEDINTTAPQDKPAAWRMPEPVFRKTSGRLPKNFENRVDERGAVQIAPEAETEAALSTPEPTPKSPVLKIILVALAIAAMIAFLIVFLTVVYFLFFRWNGSE